MIGSGKCKEWRKTLALALALALVDVLLPTRADVWKAKMIDGPEVKVKVQMQ